MSRDDVKPSAVEQTGLMEGCGRGGGHFPLIA